MSPSPDGAGADASADPGIDARIDAARAQMHGLWRADERECLPPLIAAAELSPAHAAHVAACAHALIEGSRRAERGGVAALTRQLALDSPAGLALLALAEALLRVPDAATADRLIRDQLAGIHRRRDGPRAAPGPLIWAVRLAASLACVSASSRFDPRRLGRPLLRGAARLMLERLGSQFIFGESIEAALRRARRRGGGSYRYSFDMLGEAALTEKDAQRYHDDYERAIRAVGAGNHGLGAIDGNTVSVKLSALEPRYDYAQRAHLRHRLLPRVRALALLARHYRTALTIDAEEAARLEPSLEVIEALMADSALADWAGLGVAVQAYQKRAPAVIDYLAGLAAKRRQPLLVRLVKGAYWDLEIKAAQQEGLAGYPVYTRKLYTDVAYLACARRLLDARAHLVPQFATHNAQTVAQIAEMAQVQGVDPGGLEFQCLHGMGAALYRQLTRLLGPAATGAHLCTGGPAGDPVAVPDAAPAGERCRQLVRASRAARVCAGAGRGSRTRRRASGRRAASAHPSAVRAVPARSAQQRRHRSG